MILSRGLQTQRSIAWLLLGLAMLGLSLQAFAQDRSERLGGPAKKELREQFGPAEYQNMLKQEKAGEIPSQAGAVPSGTPSDVLVNNNAGAIATGNFTQSETSILAFGSRVVVGFNDAGSNANGTNRFTGYAYSVDGGATFTDGGSLPSSVGGDAGDPILARDETTGRIYFATLGFDVNTIQVWRSDDNGVSWMAPVNGTPGPLHAEDKQWLAVDNFSGTGNGKVYLLSRNFSSPNGIYLYTSSDGGATFGPSGGTLIVSGMQGAFIAVGPDHSVYAFWHDGGAGTLKMRKSTDTGFTFGPAVTVASGLVGGVNGDLGLTGIRQGTSTPSAFRTNEFPHAAVNPVSGHLYATFNNKGVGTDKADVFLVQSVDGGATWSAPIKVNDDATTTDQWMPTVAVTPDGVNLGIFYYSRQEDPVDNNLFKYYGRTGTLSGSAVTFTPSQAISDVASLPEFGRDAVVNATYMGDYNQASATPGKFHVVWSDNRDDFAGGAPRKDPNIYYKSIQAGLLSGPNITVIPTQVDFGSVLVGETTGPVAMTIQNIGDANLTVSAISSPAADFSSSLPSLPVVIPSLGTATLTVSFSPLSVGTQNSLFVITSDALNTPADTVNLTGRGFVTASNDLCANPIPIDCGGSVSGNTANATRDTLPICSGVPSTAPGLWYTVVGTGGVISVSTCTPAASYNTRLSVFSGTCGSLVCVGDNDDFCSTGSQVTWSSVNGTTYYILVHGSGNSSGTFTLSTSACPALISANPPALNIAVPVNGTGLRTLSISNTADAGAQNLIWSITTLETGPASAPFKAVIPGMYPMDHPQSMMRNTPPAAKGPSVGKSWLSVDKREDALHEFPFDQSYDAARRQQEVVGSVGAPAAVPSSGLGTEVPDGVHSTDYIVSYTAAAVPFLFEDISATGTIIAPLTGADDGAALITPGFTFPFFSGSFNTFGVSSNGLVTFGSANTAFTNTDLTTSPAQASISPFWDDQIVSGTASSKVLFQVLGAGSTERLVIQWNEVSLFSGGAAGDPITYQAVLFANGSIQLNYLDLVSGSAAGNNGGSATVGLKDAGTQGPNRLLLAFNNGPNAFVGTGKSTLISPIVSCPWISSITPGSGSVPPGSSEQVVISVDAAGLAVGTYNCEIRVASNAINSNPLIIPVTLTVSADPPAVISIAPPVFNIALPVNGTGSGTLGISNTAGAGALDLNWLITTLQTGPASVSFKAVIPGMYPMDHPQSMMRNTPPAAKGPSVGKSWLSVDKRENALHEFPFDQSYNAAGKKQEVVGSVGAPAAVPSSGLRTEVPDGVHNTDDIISYTAAAVPFLFEDISATGTIITPLTGADDGAALITPGFTFPFFSSSFDSFSVSSNGLITFRGANTAFTNADLTTSPTQASISPFWDDQIVAGTANSKVLFQVLGAGSTERLVIQWNEVSLFSGGTAGDPITYQAVLFANGSIQLNYPDLVSGSAAGNNGGSATVGLKDAGTQGPNRLLLAFNNGPNAFVGTGKSTLISPVAGPTACGWITSITPGFGSVAQGGSQQVTVGVNATGLLAGVYNCEIKVFSDASNGSPVIVPAILTVGPVSAVPVVNSPISAGSTSVSGTSTEANGTVIEVFVNSSSAGTTNVTGGNWTKSGLAALAAGDTVKATATASGELTSGFSNLVIVQDVTAAPVVNSPILAGTTSVSGTSSEANGTVIQLFVNSAPAGSTTVTGGVWTKSGLIAAADGRSAKQEPRSKDDGDIKSDALPAGLVAGDTVKATATATGKLESAFSNSVIVSPGAASVNVITNPGFESGKSPWVFFTDGTGAYSLVSPGATGSNAAKLTITTPGTNTQFYQAGRTLEAATLYRLTFKARSSTGHNFSVFVQRHDAPYTDYGLNGVVFDVTTSWQTFTVQFTTINFPPPSPSNARLRFRLNGFAAAGDQYFIDDVVLEKVAGGGPVATKIKVETAANGTGSVVPAQIVNPGDSITVYAIARDAGNNFVGNIAATWSLINVSGGVVAGDLVPSGDAKSATFKGNGAGKARIQAASGGLTPTPSDTITVPTPPPAANLVVNGGFESGTANWTFQTNGAGSFTAVSPGNVGSKAGQVSITTQGTAVQLFQRNISLTSGSQYRLSFKAVSNTGHDVSVSIFKHLSPFTPYGLPSQVFNLTNAWASYSVDFTASGFGGTVGDARLRFWFSPYDAAGDVYQFDDVRLELLPAPPALAGATTSTGLPAEFAMMSNFPNPFNPSTTIIYTLPVDAHVTLDVYDVLGRRVAQLVDGTIVAGYHDVVFDASALASGLYFYRITATAAEGVLFSKTQKMLLAK